MKYLGINLIKEVKDLNWENNVILMKEIGGNANGKVYCIHGWKH